MTLAAIFTGSAAAHPERLALDVPPEAGGGRVRLRYGELRRWAAQVARQVGEREGDAVVAILADRASPALYAAQIGVSLAGAAHLCLDPVLPELRQRRMLEVARPDLLFAGPGHLDRALALAPAAPRVEPLGGVEEIRAAGEWWAAPEIPPERLAYVIFTSGSTGTPKGVAIEHRAIANLIEGDRGAFRLGPGDRVAQVSSPAYDSSVEETWLALSCGATLVPVPAEVARSGPDLAAFLRRERVTVFCPPPSLLRAMGVRDPGRELPDLRLLYVGGEALPPDVAARWGRDVRMVNGYGPTECSVTALRAEVEPGRPITIGRPVPGIEAFVLDGRGDEVAGGRKGELWLGGVGLARGYLGSDAETARRFVVHPRHGRLYRTGDLVRRDEGGEHHYLGRVDSQVKVRGHRLELEEVEAALMRLEGVAEAGAAVQGDGTAARLVAFIVPRPDHLRPGADELDGMRAALREVLPPFAVPAAVGCVDTLPRSVGGKLDRRRFPELAATPRRGEPPRGPVEEALAGALVAAWGLAEPPSPHADLFEDLGGDSVRAALLVTQLREDQTEARLATLSVRDVYEAPTLAALAARLAAKEKEGEPGAGGMVGEETRAPVPEVRSGLEVAHPARAGVVQGGFLLALALLATPLVAWLSFSVFPWFLLRFGLLALILIAPLALGVLRLLAAPLTIGLAVAAKWLLIGRYRTGRHRVWGGFHLRHWIVTTLARLAPFGALQGTELLSVLLRLFGARVGRGVHVHRGVNLARGGWDLIEIGDGAVLQQEAALRAVVLRGSEVVAGPVRVGAKATVGVRAALSPGSGVGREARLGPLSLLAAGESVPAGEEWAGVPARYQGATPPPPARDLAEREHPFLRHGLLLLAGRLLLGWVASAPAVAATISIILATGLDGPTLLAWLYAPSAGWGPWLALPAWVALWTVLALLGGALTASLLGWRCDSVRSRWALSYLRTDAVSILVAAANRTLSGTMAWPWWLRLAGMRAGQRVEISTILDAQPRQLRLGEESFLADGVYWGCPEVDRGTVRVATTVLGARTFVGNHAVIPPGVRGEDDVLLGVCTVASEGTIGAGGAWFGEPPFRLRRAPAPADARVTLRPSLPRRATRAFWEALRFLVAWPPLLVFLLWFRLVGGQVGLRPLAPGALAVVFVGGVVAVAVVLAGVIAAKWALIGRARPGEHPLWSCWCSRWDWLYVLWGAWARPLLTGLEGTPLLRPWLLAMGARIGRRCVLGEGFAQLTDPDMIALHEGSCATGLFQAHSFEDRVLKLDRVVLKEGAFTGEGSVLLHGASIGVGAAVEDHAVVMKREHLIASKAYIGVPARPATSEGREPPRSGAGGIRA